MAHRRLPLLHAAAPALGAQLLLLVTLTHTAGLGPAGAVAGLVGATALLLVLAVTFRGAAPGPVSLGPADVVTLTRALLVAGVAALVVDGLVTGQAPPTVPLVAVTVAALLLDGVDGQVARRTGTSSAHGARFDMEVDAVLLLVLSVHVAGLFGPWVLAIGLMRYAFVVAGRALPWLQGSLPVSYLAKTVAAVQGVVLVVATAQLLPTGVAHGVLAVSVLLLCWSFGRSVVYLWPTAARVRAAAAAPAVLPARPVPVPLQRGTPVPGLGTARVLPRPTRRRAIAHA